MKASPGAMAVALMVGVGSLSSRGEACGIAPPECGPLAAVVESSLPANAGGIRVQTPFRLDRLDPDDFHMVVTDPGGVTSEVAIEVFEPQEGVYDVVPSSGFVPLSSYRISAPSACGEGEVAPNEVSFSTLEEVPLPDLEGAELEVSISTAVIEHFDSAACASRSERSRSAVVTAPDVDPVWQESVLYHWTVNGSLLLEQAKARQQSFARSCESSLGWSNAPLSIDVEARLPGASEPLWIDSTVVELECDPVEASGACALSGGARSGFFGPLLGVALLALRWRRGRIEGSLLAW